MVRLPLSMLLCCFGGITGFQGPLIAQEANVPAEPSSSNLKVVVIAGEGGVNSLRARSAVQPIVQVLNAQGQSLPAAVVTFDGPDSGPGVIFSNGSRSQSLISELDGRVTVTGMQPVGLGQFRLTVTAVYDQQFATAIIDQANLRSAAASASGSQSLTPAARTSESNPKSGLSTRAKYGIIAGIAVAAAVGIAIAVTRGGGSSTSTVAGPGTPTVGAPH